MQFTWDPVKAAANAKNHGVTFAEAMTVFDDPLYISYADASHSITEDRFLTVGISQAGRLLVVWHTGDSGRNPPDRRTRGDETGTQEL